METAHNFGSGYNWKSVRKAGCLGGFKDGKGIGSKNFWSKKIKKVLD